MNLVKQKYFIIISIVGSGILFLQFLHFSGHIKPDELAEKKDNSIRIVAANINFQNRNSKKISGFLSGLNADILVILEYTGSNLDLSVFESKGYLAVLSKPLKSPHGICTLITSEIEADGTLTELPYVSPCQMPLATIRFKHKEQYISVWGIHTPPPIPVCEFKTSDTISELASFVSNGRLIKKLGVSKENDLIIMAGDFNMFWFHPSLAALRKTGLKDGYQEQHILPSVTWSPLPWFPKFVGLDYIFCSKHFTVLDSYIMKISGSDHSLVITDLEMIHPPNKNMKQSSPPNSL